MSTRNFIGVDPDMHFISLWHIRESTDDGSLKFDRINIEVPKTITGRDALTDMSFRLVKAEIIDTFRKWGPVCAAAIESQELYQFGAAKTQNPKSIMQLATVAGMLMQTLHGLGCEELYFPAPQKWKGNVPKAIHQARICRSLEWGYTRHGSDTDGYCVPLIAQMADDIDMRIKSHWKHALDSIGLALYARDVYTEERERDARRAAAGRMPGL